MKIYTLLFITTIFILNIYSSELLFASQSPAMADMPITSCLEKVDIQSTLPEFKNWYHANLPDRIIQKYWIDSRKAVCGFYVAGGDVTRIQLASVIPIYMPRIVAPVGLQNTYVGQDYIYPERTGHILWATNASVLMNKRSLVGFQFGGLGLRVISEDRIIYLKSLEEPFRSAPTIQLYAYIGSPLLVARSQTGIVTDVFFQRTGVSDPMKIAQRYLGDKWYHP